MKDESFQYPATTALINMIRAEWERIHGPAVTRDLRLQQDLVEEVFRYTGKADVRDITRAEATLYHELLKTRPAYRALTDGDLDRVVRRLA